MNKQSDANGFQTDRVVTLINVLLTGQKQTGDEQTQKVAGVGGTAVAVKTSDWPAPNARDRVIIQSPAPVFLVFFLQRDLPNSFHIIYFQGQTGHKGGIVLVKVQAVPIQV